MQRSRPIDRVREGANLVLKRRTLSYAEASDFDARVRSMALELMSDIDAGRTTTRAPRGQGAPLINDELRDFLDRISDWDSAAWFAHTRAVPGDLRPPALLAARVPECRRPPGHFGTPGGPDFRPVSRGRAIVSARRVRAARREVAALLGRRLLQSRIDLPGRERRLAPPGPGCPAYLDTINRTFPIRRHGRKRRQPLRFDGVHAFLDDFAFPRLVASHGAFAGRG